MTKHRLMERMTILDDLLAQATPSEREYYTGLHARLKRQLERFDAPQPQGAAEPTPEEMAEHITEGYKGLHWFEYELSKDLDPHWRAYFAEQREHRIAALKDLEGQLAALGHPYTPPTLDLAAEAAEEKAAHHEMRIDELKHFRRLLLSWAERNGTPESDLPELRAIDDELAQLTA